MKAVADNRLNFQSQDCSCRRKMTLETWCEAKEMVGLEQTGGSLLVVPWSFRRQPTIQVPIMTAALLPLAKGL